jgi:hypothetical protein
MNIDPNLYKFLCEMRAAEEKLAQADAQMAASKDFRKQCMDDLKAIKGEMLEYFARADAKDKEKEN